MGLLNEATKGADLTHPKLSFGYVIAAVVSIAVLMLALWLYGKAKLATSGVTGKASASIAQVGNNGLTGLFGNGT